MSAYLFPVKMALMIFPFLALVLALPVFVGQYRRFGSFVFWRAVVIYTFIFYLLTAYFMVILPLPTVASVAKMTGPTYNLVPFKVVSDFFKQTVFVLSEPATWLAALKQNVVIQPLFNLLLTLPFGVYLRYYFKRSLKRVLLLSFGLSLFFELTQLTGLYGIYPRPYRLFDVDDLVLNSLGGLLGGLLAPALMRLFPTREQMDAKAYERGQRVTFTRRFVAFLIDNVIAVGLFTMVVGLVAQLLHVSDFVDASGLGNTIPLLIVFLFWPAVAGGQTLGKKLVRIRIVKRDGAACGFWRLAWREFLLYGVAYWALRGLIWSTTELFSKMHQTPVDWLLFALTLGATLFFLVDILVAGLRRTRVFHDVWAGTTQVSTVERPVGTESGSSAK
ncbi:VanZ family protein [Lacticaseibacillus yichunensis]|uniref:VanZ family protein n=1 Tax=Lacticaseibacillus yichunensis TaxID=2486015 RepID=A0ABW4CTD3_9LACO|nr:VanZ family protein [Lacticaseibacillus yichunensis]